MNKVLLIVRDGWGYSKEVEGNAIIAADTPFDDYLNAKHTPVILGAHGRSVGLPNGFQGSSEVGHMNMGAGKIITQEVTRINDLLESQAFFKSKSFEKITNSINSDNVNIHLMGLLQDEGVPAGPVMNERDCYSDPHLKEREFFQELTQVDCGTHLYPGIQWKMTKTPNKIRRSPCLLGEHNEYVYKQVISVSDEEYAELERTGHIGMDFVIK